MDDLLKAAYGRVVDGGGRRFFDQDPEYAELMQRIFQRCGPHAIQFPGWFGGGGQQFPADYMIYQHLLCATRPRLLIETGTGGGGTTLFFAEALERIIPGEWGIITIESHADRPGAAVRAHPRITSIIGDSTDPEVISAVRVAALARGGPVAATLDSSHDAKHVLAELALYAPLVSSGQYLIVQDTFLGFLWGGNLDGDAGRNAVARRAVREFDYRGLPLGAIEAWLDVHGHEWTIDLAPQQWGITQNPYGLLRRA
jgi:cephalosporin hydroxylase